MNDAPRIETRILERTIEPETKSVDNPKAPAHRRVPRQMTTLESLAVFCGALLLLLGMLLLVAPFGIGNGGWVSVVGLMSLLGGRMLYYLRAILDATERS